MLVPVPFADVRIKLPEYLEFVVVVDDQPRMLDHQIPNRQDSAKIAIDDPPHQGEQFAHMPDRSILERIPSSSPDSVKKLSVVFRENVHSMPGRVFLERHLHKNTAEFPYKPLRPNIPIHFRVLCETRENDMLAQELGSVLVEPVCDEDWNIVEPGVPRCSTQEHPLIILDYLQERLYPYARSD